MHVALDARENLWIVQRHLLRVVRCWNCKVQIPVILRRKMDVVQNFVAVHYRQLLPGLHADNIWLVEAPADRHCRWVDWRWRIVEWQPLSDIHKHVRKSA